MTKSLLLLDTSRPLEFKRVSSFGFNTCHAVLAMRSDLQRQMERSHQELGMRYWRCHGTTSDEVGIVISDEKGGVDYTFSGLKRILDEGLKTGVRPFFEISFMPSLLAQDPSKTLCHYAGITSPPKDPAMWRDFIVQLIEFLVETYGKEELRKWYFEVWNEPNLPFWAGTKEEYFELYRTTVLAIKSVDSMLRVGGPATARAEWVVDLLTFCQKTTTPLDFVSVHIYPSDVAFSESAKGDVKILGTEYLYGHLRQVRADVDALMPGTPVIWGEWNSSAGPFAANHDECNNAALISCVLMGIEEFGDGSLYWNISDIYEEGGFHFAPFHGGYGLYTVDHIPKSSARAFELWEMLRGDRVSIGGLPSSIERHAFATFDQESGDIGILLWNHMEPDIEPIPWEVSISLDIPIHPVAEVKSIVPHRGSAYESWIDMGRPLNLTNGQLSELQRASAFETKDVTSSAEGAFHFTIAPGTLTLVQIRAVQS